MSSQKWTDKEIEKQLEQLPKMTDHRSAANILSRLQEDERLQKVPTRKRPTILWLSVAMVAMLLVSFALPSIFNWRTSQFEHVADVAQDEEITVENEDIVPIDAREFHLEEERSHIVQESALENYTNVQLDLYFDEQVIPVSLLIPITKIREDFPSEQPTSLQLYERYGQNISEDALGETSDVAVHFDGEFQADEQSTATVEEQSLSELQGGYSYYAYTNARGKSYLVKEMQSGLTVVEALNNMRKSPSKKVQPLVSESDPYEIVMRNDVAHIQFVEELDLLSMNEEEAYRLIEGFMLTAASFHTAVKFENVLPTSFGQYDLSEPLPKPVGSNPIYLFDE